MIDPRNHLAGRGGGGSRAGFMGLVRAMGRRGDYEVTAFSTFMRPEEELDGVRYVRLDGAEKAWGEGADVCFAYYDVRELLRVQPRPGVLTIGSHHTLVPFMAWPRIHVNTAPCEWAVDFLRRGYRPLARWEVLPNAVEGLDGVDWKPVPGRVFCHMSPDRGLHRLLHAWPEIRRRVPEAELHVTGEPEGMARAYLSPEWAGSCEARVGRQLADGIVAAEEAGGVKFLGRVSREVMLRELSEASVLPFPAEVYAPCETFSISILEAMHIGVPVVLSPVDALESLWGDHAATTLSTGHPGWKAHFVDRVEVMIRERNLAKVVSDRGRAYARTFTFERAAGALHGIVQKHAGGPR